MSTIKCEYCNENFNSRLSICPHCARPSLFPNVRDACAAEELAALNSRYENQLNLCKTDESKEKIKLLLASIEKSTACIAMRRWDIERLIAAETATAATYFEQINGNSRIPDDDKWDRLRRIADASFFQCYGHKIHFAALSIGSKWLHHYGDGALFFKPSMISHRATVFEKNTAVWVQETDGSLNIPKGHISSWENRATLAVVKIAGLMNGIGDLDKLILSAGITSEQDVFMEVHIYGGFTIRSAKSIIVKKGTISELGRKLALERASAMNISFTEIE